MEMYSYCPVHLKQCAELFVKVFNASPWNDKWTTEKAAVLLTRFSNMPDFKGFVGEIDGKIAGACFGYKKMWWWGEEYYIEEMYIAQEHQRSGLGSKLMKYIEDVLKEENITAITLSTGRSTPAKDFYLKNSFYVVEDIIFMKKRI